MSFNDLKHNPIDQFNIWFNNALSLDVLEVNAMVLSTVSKEGIPSGRVVLLKDFAHAPSKVKATTAAVRKQFKGFKLVACLELHTYSSLDFE